ncbi:MAG: potassium transporter KefB [Bacteroidetes bacterium]|nr:MAG: potassium transporter KefB [Bacteroidota bacterium]
MGILLDLTIIFSIAALVLYLSARVRIPTIVGLLFSGLIAGPHGLRLVQATEEVELLAEIGILLLLFTIGMEFSLEKLLKTRKWIFAGGGMQVLFTTGLIFLVSRLVGLTWQQSLFTGFLFSLSSTAIVLHLLQEKGKMDSKYGGSALAILIFQDVAIIPMMLLVPYLSEAGGEGMHGLLELGKGILIVAVIIFLARKIIPGILRSVVHTRNQELFLMTILVICFATAMITYQLGLKLALGAFLAGLIVSESEFSYDALSHMLPLKKIFTSIFFISIGMLLNVSFFAGNAFMIIGLTILVMMIKTSVIVAVGLQLKLSIRNALIVGLSLCQVGEFAFVLANAGRDSAILSTDQNQVFLAVSIFSMAVSPFIIGLAPKIATWVVTRGAIKKFARKTEFNLVGKHLHRCTKRNHLVIIGFGSSGQILAGQAHENDIGYSIIELNEKISTQFLNEGEPVFPGDGRSEDVLLHAAADRAKTIVIAVHDAAAAEAITIASRKINHSAHIIVRSRFSSEIETLIKLGANEVIPERLEAARRISERTIVQFTKMA